MANINKLLTLIENTCKVIRKSDQAYDLSMIVQGKAREAFSAGNMDDCRCLQEVADYIWKFGDYLFDKEFAAAKPAKNSRASATVSHEHVAQAQRFMDECNRNSQQAHQEFVLRSMGVI